MQNYKNLDVWEKAHSLAVHVYKATESFPKDELWGLTSQIRRSSVSVPSNIAEGCGRNGDAELGRFLQIALGSANELEYQLFLAHELKMLSAKDHENLNNEIGEMRKRLISFVQKLKSDNPTPIAHSPKPIAHSSSPRAHSPSLKAQGSKPKAHRSKVTYD